MFYCLALTKMFVCADLSVRAKGEAYILFYQVFFSFLVELLRHVSSKIHVMTFRDLLKRQTTADVPDNLIWVCVGHKQHVH